MTESIASVGSQSPAYGERALASPVPQGGFVIRYQKGGFYLLHVGTPHPREPIGPFRSQDAALLMLDAMRTR